MAKKQNSKVRVMMLGGLNEIGKNIAVIEYENDIIVIDCGLAFPDEDMLGVDLVRRTRQRFAAYSLLTDTRTISAVFLTCLKA